MEGLNKALYGNVSVCADRVSQSKYNHELTCKLPKEPSA